MANKRSDISKLVSAARKIWRESENYKEAKKAAKDPQKTGWFICRSCSRSAEVIRVDHIEPIGQQPQTLSDFGGWLERLFCSLSNLQPLCTDCHKKKTALERKEAARARKIAKAILKTNEKYEAVYKKLGSTDV